MTGDCVFCHPDRPLIAANDHALAFYDAFPVTRGHTLIVPRRHVATIFETGAEEYAGCFALAREVRAMLVAEFAPDGFNLGVNSGAAAGQSVWHAHIHLIPRFRGDDPDPRGGVRRVVAGKADYCPHPGPARGATTEEAACAKTARRD